MEVRDGILRFQENIILLLVITHYFYGLPTEERSQDSRLLGSTAQTVGETSQRDAS